jgi:hypothetical protein
MNLYCIVITSEHSVTSFTVKNLSDAFSLTFPPDNAIRRYDIIIGDGLAQAVSRRIPTAAARIRPRVG